MLEQDLSGPTNGLIILSSVSLAIIQFFYSDLKARHAEAKSRAKEFSEPYPHLDNEALRKRYDNIRTAQINNVRNEMMCLFAILIACGLIKSFDLLDLWKNGSYDWHSYVVFALMVLTFFFSILLAWTAIALAKIGAHVTLLENQAVNWCEQMEAVTETMTKLGSIPTSPPSGR